MTSPPFTIFASILIENVFNLFNGLKLNQSKKTGHCTVFHTQKQRFHGTNLVAAIEPKTKCTIVILQKVPRTQKV